MENEAAKPVRYKNQPINTNGALIGILHNQTGRAVKIYNDTMNVSTGKIPNIAALFNRKKIWKR